MEQIKLSNEEKARVFAMYLGCEVLAPHPQIDGEELPGYLTGISGEHEAEVQHLEDGNVWEHPEYHDYDATKLRLTPLELITDEDAIEAAKILGKKGDRHYWVERNEKEVRVWFGTECVYMYANGEIFFKNDFWIDYSVYEFLKSKGYATPLYFTPNHPANGKTAIELGLAINKSKL